jgi:hypothetical protein
MGDVSCADGDGNNLLTWGFVGPAVLAGYWSCHSHDGGAVLVGLQVCGDPVQEGLSFVFLAGVLSVCMWCCPSVYTVPVLT